MYCHHFAEHLHSSGGALEESRYNFLEGTRLMSITHRPLNILDVGFGMGTSLKALMLDKELNGHIHYTSFEIDQTLCLHFLRKLNY